MYNRYNILEAMTSESSIRKRKIYKYPKALQTHVYTGRRSGRIGARDDGGQGGWGGRGQGGGDCGAGKGLEVVWQ